MYAFAPLYVNISSQVDSLITLLAFSKKLLIRSFVLRNLRLKIPIV